MTPIRTLSTANTESALFVLRREQVDPVLVARFTVDGEPMSKARARVVNGHAFTPERTRVAEAGVRAAFLAAERTATPAPLHSDTKYGVVALFFHQTRQRRDVDNMLKLILDALNGHAWLDDTQVVEVSARKTLVPKGHARTEVAVYEVGVTDPNLGQCGVCGKPTMSYDSLTRRTCSKECAATAINAARDERQKRQCRRCGEHFTTTGDATYCSTACREATHVDYLTCEHCGQDFRQFVSWRNKGHHFCSKECQATFWRLRRAASAKGTCQACGGTVSRKEYIRCRPCVLEGREVPT